MGKKRWRHRAICITLNNPTATERTEFSTWATCSMARAAKSIRYIVFQEECADQRDVDEGTGVLGTLHLQGYIELLKAMGPRTIKKKINKRMHFEERQGKQHEAIAYCKKQRTRVADGLNGEGGTPARQKECTDSLIQDIQSGNELSQIMTDHPKQYLHLHSGIDKMQSKYVTRRNWNMEIVIYYGIAGTGKTYKAFHDHPNAYVLSLGEDGNNAIWFDHTYEGQTIIINEFRSQLKYGYLLKLWDCIPMTLAVKYSHTQMRSHKIVFTTNIEPMNWYPGKDAEGFSMLKDRLLHEAKIYDFVCSKPSEPRRTRYKFTKIVLRKKPVARSVGYNFSRK